MNTKQLNDFWSQRYSNKKTGWDIGAPSLPLKAYIGQLKDKTTKILIPGAGNAYEAEYLHQQGFGNVHILDISLAPLTAFKNRVKDFPVGHIHHGNFFDHQGQYDLILEQTFFCSFEPSTENRSKYAAQMARLIAPGGKLVGLWFNHPLVIEGKRPFGGNKEEYINYFTSHFTVHTFEDCYNSIESRSGKEHFGILIRL